MNPNTCMNCGGELIARNGRMVCLNCGSYKPLISTGEETSFLYSAYQKLRMTEFLEAEKEFDDIIRKNPCTAGAYWGRLMARYGIKYENDFNGKKVPTCYATTIESIFDSDDYRKALEFADDESRAVYKEHAAYIESVREEWLKKASKEKPYDIFLCYKDSDAERGLEHTPDSDELRDLYMFLMEKGYRVFFSRETLRHKGGEKYEPYIFHALSTAEVMIVYGSRPDYINSTWVKNEWTRYQKYIQEGQKHPDALVVAYKGFSPKELPLELSSSGRQHLDASTPGFYVDLLDAIEHVMESEIAITSTGEIACDHVPVIIPGQAPTCTKGGTTKGAYCSVCGNILKPVEMLPPTGHRFGEWRVSKKASCLEDGEYERVCECGERETKIIPARGFHVSSGDWELVRTPGIGKTGLMAKKCIVCDEHLEEIVLPALPAVDLIPSKHLSYKVDEETQTCEITDSNYCRDASLVIPETIDGYRVTSIAEKAFKGNSSAELICIPDSVKTIGSHAFYGCTNLKNVIIGNSVEKIEPYTFYGCPELTSIILGMSVKSIGSYAFYSCKNLMGVVIPNSVARIEFLAFGLCESLKDLFLGKNVRYVGSSAFSGCTNLANVSIPESLTDIGSQAFRCGAVSFRVSKENKNFSDVEGCLCSKDGKTLIRYTVGKKDARFTIPSTITHIADEAFYGAKNLIDVVIPESVIYIGKEAFKNCKKLTSLTYGGKKRLWKNIEFHDEWKNGSALTEVTVDNSKMKLK